MRFPMVQPVTEMTRAALGNRLAPGAVEYLDMFHDDAVFEFPFATGGPVRKEGKPAMAEYLASIEGSTVFDRFDLKASYPIRDGGMVLEYHAHARAGAAKTPFEQDYVAVVETAGGRIRLYREFLDPLNIPGVADGASDTPLDHTPLPGPLTSLDAMLKDALGDRLAPGADGFIDMFATEGVLECPFAPPGALRSLAGKEAITRYYKRLTAIQGSDGMVLNAIHPAEQGDHAFLEYEGMVLNKRDGGRYRQRYLAVVTVSEGRLTLFREYWNPLPLVASFGPAGPVPIAGESVQDQPNGRLS